MSTSITVSGSTSPADTSFVYPTYDSDQLGVQLPWPNLGNSDKVPSFIYFMGNVVYKKDKAGNVVAENPNVDGSLPV